MHVLLEFSNRRATPSTVLLSNDVVQSIFHRTVPNKFQRSEVNCDTGSDDELPSIRLPILNDRRHHIVSQFYKFPKILSQSVELVSRRFAKLQNDWFLSIIKLTFIGENSPLRVHRATISTRSVDFSRRARGSVTQNEDSPNVRKRRGERHTVKSRRCVYVSPRV